MNFLASLLSGDLTSIVTAAGSIVAVLAGLFLVRKSGADAVRSEVATQTLEIKDAQQQAAASAPRGRDAVADSLRSGEF